MKCWKVRRTLSVIQFWHVQKVSERGIDVHITAYVCNGLNQARVAELKNHPFTTIPAQPVSITLFPLQAIISTGECQKSLHREKQVVGTSTLSKNFAQAAALQRWSTTGNPCSSMLHLMTLQSYDGVKKTSLWL